MRRVLLLLAVLALVALAGCTASGLDPSEAYNGSEAVADAEVVERGSEFEETLYLNVTLEQTVEKNDENCVTTYNPALGTSQTTCYDNWHEAAVTGVTVTAAEGDYQRSVDASAGDTVSVPLSSVDGVYNIAIESENAPPTHFQVTVEDGTISTAGYDDTY